MRRSLPSNAVLAPAGRSAYIGKPSAHAGAILLSGRPISVEAVAVAADRMAQYITGTDALKSKSK